MVRVHQGPIYRFLHHLTRDTGAAEELTQETFAAAWQRLQQFDGRASLGTWLHRIAYTRFIDSCRRQRRETAAVGTLNGHAGATEHTAPAAHNGVLKHEGWQRLMDALAQLEPDLRALLILHYTQGLSYRDIAIVTDQPDGTVKWRISSALKSLRIALCETDHESATPARQPS